MMETKHTVLGILAHVDAGKTTLSEAMLYCSGRLKTLGRVDHKNSFLDTHTLERERGITIFSKQALLDLPHTHVSLLDTPGHVDFAAEAERTLQVLDYAVLVISGTDGVQAHTDTLWRLLRRYRVPTFLFVTKMDLPGPGRETILAELQRELDESCQAADGADRDERFALCDEGSMERYLETGALSDTEIARLITARKLFPVFFGSGLKTEGVEELLTALDAWTLDRTRPGSFAAKVYKIERDAQGKRLTWLKVTAGALRVRDAMRYQTEAGEAMDEKVSQLRLYSGSRYEAVESVPAGQTVAVLGLTGTWPGQGLGGEPDSDAPVLEPVLSYRVILPPKADAQQLLPRLMELSEEDPQLHVVWLARSREIAVQLMGRMQTEILRSLVKERFDLDITLSSGRILYRETIKNKVEGVGHFEPLRHYAEVHLTLEPLPRGSGIVMDSVCSENELDRNWQRLILTHLAEKRHLGVLTGAPITDIKLTLCAGKAHLKHTEGGDFREATYRAVRQGLMQAESVLLEPWYAFTLELPTEQIGRAISDIRGMGGEFDSPEERGGRSRLSGTAPVSKLNGYAEELAAYSRGKGRLSLRPNGYREAKDADRIVADIGYDPEADLDNTPDSVFCAHGAGYTVKWNDVPSYMHLPSVLKPRTEVPPARPRSFSIDERELEAIMEREFGPVRRPLYRTPARNEAPILAWSQSPKQKYLLVDGYNVIFAWEELRALAADNLDLARQRLMDELSNYASYTKTELVLVFDAYRTPASTGRREDYHSIHVAYTEQGETADAYIERIASSIGKNYAVRVITSDSLIQLSALGAGILRGSSREFEEEVRFVRSQIEEVLRRSNELAHLTSLKDGTARIKEKS